MNDLTYRNKIKENRVVITGIGVVTANSLGKESFWDVISAGKSGFGRITSFDPSAYRTQLAAEIRDFDPTKFLKNGKSRQLDRFSHLGIAACKMALEDASWNLGRRDNEYSNSGVYIGSGVGGMLFYEEQCKNLIKQGSRLVHPSSIPKIMPNSVSANIAREFGFNGPNYTISTACSSSSHAIGIAFDQIRNGRIKTAIAGGAEAPLLPVLFAAFDNMRVMTSSKNPDLGCRPFDKERDGFILGEGSVVFTLEDMEYAKKSRRTIYGEIIGYGASNGTHHMVIPDPSGKDIIKAMSDAISDANIEPGQVNYINAHGTGTKVNDELETMVIKKIFGDHAKALAISSTKSMVGHLIGGAAAVGVAASLLALTKNIIPPTANLRNADPACDLDYVPLKSKSKQVTIAMVNSFGFGNNNGTLILKKADI